MRRYNGRQPQKPTPQGPKEICSIDCGNMTCRFNLRSVGKGERFTVKPFHVTERCRGYRAP